MIRSHATTLTVIAVLATGCGGGGGNDDAGRNADAGTSATDASTSDTGPALPDAAEEHAPIFRNSVSTPDAELAAQALRLMGAPEAGGSGSCHECHGLTRESIASFRTVTDTAWASCFPELDPAMPAAAQSIVACFRDSMGYHTGNLGIFATGATFEWFQYVFRKAYGDTWETEYAMFLDRVQQPPSPRTPFTQPEFDLLTEWFLRGTPMVDAVLPPTDGPGECTPWVAPVVADIVAEGERTGWGARNEEDAILMHGCAGAASTLDCLSSYPRASETSYGATWETAGTHQRVLFDVPYHSSYWTRSSADGRFVAHGGNNAGAGASIIDLERSVVIPTDAMYDPGFFPDNSGFVFQGTRSGPATCLQSVLTGSPTRITFGEPGCSGARSIGLYQHIGASLDGGDYWVVNSVWSGDPGDDLMDPDVFADATSEVTLRRFTNTGSGFTAAGATAIATPWEGNSVISPSMRLLVGHLADARGRPIGYVLHGIDIARAADGSVTGITLPELARYCVAGGKPAFSLDDRWLVTHHRAVTNEDAIDLGFTGATDPAFTPYRGVSNVYLIDLVTGEETRVTHMQPGQRALFPHFRSDGWLYFLVREAALPEHIVASDAGIVLR